MLSDLLAGYQPQQAYSRQPTGYQAPQMGGGWGAFPTPQGNPALRTQVGQPTPVGGQSPPGAPMPWTQINSGFDPMQTAPAQPPNTAFNGYGQGGAPQMMNTPTSMFGGQTGTGGLPQAPTAPPQQGGWGQFPMPGSQLPTQVGGQPPQTGQTPMPAQPPQMGGQRMPMFGGMFGQPAKPMPQAPAPNYAGGGMQGGFRGGMPRFGGF